MKKTNPVLQAFSLSLLLLTAFPRLQAQGFEPPVSSPFGLGTTGSFNSPAVADLKLERDKTKHVLTGNADGNSYLFSGVRPPGLATQPHAEVHVYPDPAGRLLRIENAAGSRLEMMDIRGKMLLQGTVQSSQEAFRLEAIPAGLYLIRICTEGKSDYILKILRL